jgi:microcystin-dependent protein
MAVLKLPDDVVNETVITLQDVFDTFINSIYPVGSIHISVNNTNPGTTLPGTTWIAWGSGRVPVGVNISDTDFNSVEKTGGFKTHTLNESEIPSHSHSLSGDFDFSGDTGTESNAHDHWIWNDVSPGGWAMFHSAVGGETFAAQVISQPNNQSHTHSFEGKVSLSGDTGDIGSSMSHNNLQPYITCYMWKRTS